MMALIEALSVCFYAASLAGQFEKLYSWMNYNNFSDKPTFCVKPPARCFIGKQESSRILQFSGVATGFTIPVERRDSITVSSMPQFLKTRGTAYCLLPSMASLAKLAGRK